MRISQKNVFGDPIGGSDEAQDIFNAPEGPESISLQLSEDELEDFIADGLEILIE